LTKGFKDPCATFTPPGNREPQKLKVAALKDNRKNLTNGGNLPLAPA
jgi:hypothetical protein